MKPSRTTLEGFIVPVTQAPIVLKTAALLSANLSLTSEAKRLFQSIPVYFDLSTVPIAPLVI
jgi:hypothetical protein